jgi:hypothetical protein
MTQSASTEDLQKKALIERVFQVSIWQITASQL